MAQFVIGAPGRMQDILEAMENPHHPAPQPMPPWCTFHNCKDMDTDIERLCCRQSPENCISNMAYMHLYILDEGVLSFTWALWNDLLALQDGQEPGVDQRQLRHTAYRQFVLWQHGRLGTGRRVFIPSCCVWKIRDTFPDPRSRYTGFRVSRLDV